MYSGCMRPYKSTLSPIRVPNQFIKRATNLKICYAIVEIVEGVGQTTMLGQILQFESQRYQSAIVTHRVQKYTPTLFKDSDIQVSNSYYTSLVNSGLVEYFKKFDIVVIKSGLPFFLAALKSKVPTIYVLHQPDPVLWFSGRARLNRLAARLLERPILLKHADAFISVSPWVAKWYKDHFNIDSVVIPDSFDLSVFRPTRIVDSNESFGRPMRLLCVGSWDGFGGRKRTHELIDFLPNLRKRYQGASLSLVGLSETGLMELRSYANKIGASEGLILKGKLSVEALAKEYNSADIYVTATMIEGFYRPIIEAFACGLPAVARDTSGLFDSVCLATLHHLRASEAGVLYDGSEKSFIDAISSVMSQHEKMAENAIKYAKQFDNSKVIQKYYDLFEKVLSKYREFRADRT